MTDFDLQAIERGHYCKIHKTPLKNNGECLDCENEVPAWKPTQRLFYPIHEFPFGAIGAFLWWIIGIGAVVYFGFGHLLGWR